jgi:hypothetical protein
LVGWCIQGWSIGFQADSCATDRPDLNHSRVGCQPFTVLMLKDSRDLIFDLLWWMAWSTLNMGGTSKKMRETSRIHTWPAAMWKGWSSVCLLLSVKGFLNCIVPLPPPEHKTIIQLWNHRIYKFIWLVLWNMFYPSIYWES